MKKLIPIAAVAVVAFLSAVPARADVWKIDPAHSRAHFAVRHMMVTTVRGDFGGIEGTIEYDGKDVKTLKIDASVDVGSINTMEPKRDAHLRSADFFDTGKFPKMTFKSKRAEAAGPGKVKVIGDLTIRGVTKEVTLDVDGPTPPVKHPRGPMVTGATATTKINRSDFGVNWNKALEAGGVVVSDEVSITIDVEATQEPAPAPPPPPAAPK